MRLGAVGAELLGKLPVAVGEGGHQVGAVLHLDLVGAGAEGHAPRVGGHALPAHRGPLQEVVADHVAGLLHLDGDLLRLRLLLQAQARQPHVGGRGTVTGLREDCVVGRHPLELGLGGSTYKEQRPSAPAPACGKAREREMPHAGDDALLGRTGSASRRLGVAGVARGALLPTAPSCWACVQRSQLEPLAQKEKQSRDDSDLHKTENISPSSPPPGVISKDLMTRNPAAHSSWQLLASSR